MRVNFCSGGIVQKSYTIGEHIVPVVSCEVKNNVDGLKQAIKVVSMAGCVLGLIVPKSVLAAGVEGTFGNMHSAIMTAFDAGVVLVIIFAGASWALGHRTKAIEIIIGVCCGYLLARHAIDIRDFLKGI